MSSALAYVGDSQGILASFRALIDAAEQSIVLQMYLFAQNGDQTLLLPRPGAFAYAQTVADWLIEKKRANPAMPIVVILDSNTPANPRLTRRRGVLIRQRLQEAGVIVLNACLFGARFDRRRRLVPQMNFHLAHQRVPAADWVEHQNRWQVLHNVEDHRKNLVIDGGRAGAVTSHNLFDVAYDWHENLLWLTGDVARALWQSVMAALTEALTLPQDVSERERVALQALTSQPPAEDDGRGPLRPRLTEVAGYFGGAPGPMPGADARLAEDPRCELIESAAIRPRLCALLDESGAGDELLIATAYFSDLEVLAAIERAAARGARVRVLIDSIAALPLPALAAWLTRGLVNHAVTCRALTLVERLPERFLVRVHDSGRGAMMHLKTVARLGREPVLLGGQANFTPNSFSGAYLETDVLTRAPEILAAFVEHFERLWALPESRPLRRAPGLWPALRLRMLSLLLWLFGCFGLRP
ncbi:MAG: phospholipase D-like domain-containing protein [Polyangia bacterium]